MNDCPRERSEQQLEGRVSPRRGRLWKGCFGSWRVWMEFLVQELDLLVWRRACRIAQSLTLFLAWQFAALQGIQHLKYFCKQQQPSRKVWGLVCWQSWALSAQGTAQSSRTPSQLLQPLLRLHFPIIIINITGEFILIWFFYSRVSGIVFYCNVY